MSLILNFQFIIIKLNFQFYFPFKNMSNSDDRYVFVVEWYDAAASLVRTYNLTYFLKDRTIEMFDLKNRKIFLKRT